MSRLLIQSYLQLVAAEPLDTPVTVDIGVAGFGQLSLHLALDRSACTKLVVTLFEFDVGVDPDSPGAGELRPITQITSSAAGVNTLGASSYEYSLAADGGTTISIPVNYGNVRAVITGTAANSSDLLTVTAHLQGGSGS